MPTLTSDPVRLGRGTGRRDPADVGRGRERRRQGRLLGLAVVLAPGCGWAWARALTERPLLPSLPAVEPITLMTGLFFLVLIGVLIGTSVASGRSPHVLYRPEDIDVRLSDVRGLGPLTDEVARTVDLFLAGRTFRDTMGGRARRGLLLEGPPGTGKTFLAKAMAREAGVPFLFVSATSFQSMYYGATARRIRAYFAALRAAARREGGAIGFIEEIDAIATTRAGLAPLPAGRADVACGGLLGLPYADAATAPSVTSEGTGGVVNELLVQMQSFDTPGPWQRLGAGAVDVVNLFLPASRRLSRPTSTPPEILVVAATNRAEALDPALLRPGRFDRRLVFDAPDRAGRRDIIDHYLARKAHDGDLDGDARRDQLAGLTPAYTPVMIENLLDEALVQAVRRGATAMTWDDVVQGRLLVEVGPGRAVAYSDRERALIATHEAGHAVVAWREAPHRRLEVLSIVKRGPALGMLAHGDAEDVHTRSRPELEALIRIAFGGQAAEEVFFGQVSTGPAGDLAYATRVAAQMVGAVGMGDSPVSVAAAGGPPGSDLVGKVLADGASRTAVERLLRREQARARRVVESDRLLVTALRDALLQRHELIGEEITDVLRSAAQGSIGAWRHTGSAPSGSPDPIG